MGSIADRLNAKNREQNKINMSGGVGTAKVPPPKPKRHRDPFFSGLQESATSLANRACEILDQKRKEEKRMEQARQSRMEDWEANQTHTKFKYIVVDHPKAGIIAQTFHGCLIHAEMARASYLREATVLGAGFYRLSVANNGGVKIMTYGRSESLNIDSRPEDAEIIARQIGVEDNLE